MEILHHIGKRARAELRARQQGGGDGVNGAPAGAPRASARNALDEMLQASRLPDAAPPMCIQMDLERRKARVFTQYQPTVTFQPASVVRPPTATVLSTSDSAADAVVSKHQVATDERTAVQLRRSGLADIFPLAANYIAALLLHAHLQPGCGVRHEVPLETLQRMQAWSRVSGYPDTPMLSGVQWLEVLRRWLRYLGAQAPHVQVRDGKCYLTHVRRVHPGERQPPLHGWDKLQLLSLFRVSKTADVPWADDKLLSSLPLAQIWPSLATGNATGANAAQLLLAAAEGEAPTEQPIGKT